MKSLLYYIRKQRQGNISKIEIGLALDRKPKMANINPLEVKNIGAVAQLGARLNGIQEVTGSIPVSSTFK